MPGEVGVIQRFARQGCGNNQKGDIHVFEQLYLKRDLDNPDQVTMKSPIFFFHGKSQPVLVLHIFQIPGCRFRLSSGSVSVVV